MDGEGVAGFQEIEIGAACLQGLLVISKGGIAYTQIVVRPGFMGSQFYGLLGERDYLFVSAPAGVVKTLFNIFAILPDIVA
jgi:hypothetical protein